MYLVRPPFFVKQLYSFLTWNAPQAENTIYLSFDDGPIPELTPWVLDILKKYGLEASFFCIGENIEKYPAIFNRLIREGHSIGNHTYNHLNGWKTDTETYLENIRKCDSVISSLAADSGYSRKKIFRPPYGKMKISQMKRVRTEYSIIMWDVLSGDFDRSISKEKCLKNVLDHGRNGSIIVFHDSLKAADKLYHVLPKTIEYFSEKGFKFKNLIS
jgi:peptidoglycan-N-acetylglucosamine deacetylase